MNRREPPPVSEDASGSLLYGGTLRFVKRLPMTSPQTEPVQLSKRPQRADALRNYEKLVAAAREAFTEDDRSASLEDIARRAGVGIGTLYRHFPTRATSSRPSTSTRSRRSHAAPTNPPSSSRGRR